MEYDFKSFYAIQKISILKYLFTYISDKTFLLAPRSPRNINVRFSQNTGCPIAVGQGRQWRGARGSSAPPGFAAGSIAPPGFTVEFRPKASKMNVLKHIRGSD